jgi:hypothetical protein
MTRKTACLIMLLGALSAPSYVQAAGPKPTKADVQKVVQGIHADKAKLATYCKFAAVSEEIAKATEAGDSAKIEQLGKQAEDLEKALGADYAQLVANLDQQVDPQSDEGKALQAEFETLDKQCK